MARIDQLIFAPEVQDKVSGPLNAISAAADRTGATIEQLDTRVRRGGSSFDDLAAGLDRVERGAQRVERATANITAKMEAAERQALAEGVAQERLNQVLVSGAQAREAAALQAVRGLTAEQQAAALTRAGYAQLAAQVQATATAQSNLGVRASQQLAAANDNAAASSGRMRAALGQAGFQVQDFATQVSMGQNALLAFGVQGSQLAGAFGPTGAIAGAALMIGVIAAQLLLGKSAADAFTESMTRQSDALKLVEEDARRYREGITDEARQVRELIDYYGSLSQARQSQEMRQFRRDQQDLENAQNSLRNDALGGTSGLSRAFQDQLAEAQMRAARDYGRNSQQYGLIVSSPDLQRMREFVAVVEGFRETGDVSREALARLYEQMLGLAEGSDVVSRRIRAQAEVIDGLTGKAREAEQAQAALSARAQALGLNVDTAATATDRLNRQLAALARYDQGISDNLNREIGTLQRELAAASVSAERLQQVRAQISREERLDRMVGDRQKELERQGITGQAATESLEQFRTETEQTLSRIGRLQDGIRTLETGFRNTGGAIREVNQEFGELRRHTSGLLAANTADVRNIEEITRQIRGTQLDPAVRARAEAEAQREIERTLRETERQNQQTTDSIVRYGADRFADMFSENSRGWAGMLDTFRNTFRSLMARLAAEAIIRPIIAPIVQGLGLGSLGSGGAGIGSFLGLGGGGTLGGAAGLYDPGSTTGAFSQAGQALALRQAGGYGNLGNAFTTAGAYSNTGIGFLDAGLNYNLISPTFNNTATNAALANMGGQFGPALPSDVGFAGLGGGMGRVSPDALSALTSSTPGLTIGNAIGGVAGIAGGAYGIYSGLQRGGPGGAVGALGGAAGVVGGGLTLASGLGLIGPGLAALGPYALVAAAVLAIASALLPGEKASGKGQLSRINLDTEAQSFEGLGGKRFSQDNRDAASDAVSGIATLARDLGNKLGGARIGGDVAVGVTSSRGNGPGDLYLQIGTQNQRFTNDEQGSKQLAETAARLILNEFRNQGTVQGDYAGILAASGSVEQLSQNLDWYENVYKTLTKAKEPVSAFQQSIDQLSAQFEPAIQKARELSLSVDAMTAARQREIEKLTAQRNEQLRVFDMGLEARAQRLMGNNEYADIIAFNENATAYLAQTREQLEAMGLSAEDVAQRIANAENVLTGERFAIVQDYAQRAAAVEQQAADERLRIAQESASAQVDAARSALDWLNAQSLGASSSLSPTARLSEAERQFSAAMSGGDVRALTSAADALLSNSASVYGTATAEYAQRETFVRQTVANVGNRAAWGNGDTATIAALSQMTTALTAELSSLRASFADLVAETRRANSQAMVA